MVSVFSFQKTNQDKNSLKTEKGFSTSPFQAVMADG